MKRSNLKFSLLLPLFFMLAFPLCFVWAMHNPVPHDVPVTVVGASSEQFIDQVGPKLEGKIDFSASDSKHDALAALEDQKTRAVYEPGEPGGTSTLTVAGADGRFMSQMLPMIFEPIVQAQDGKLKTVDASPLASGDANGIGLMFFMLIPVLLGFLTANIIGNACFFLRLRTRLLISAGIAVLAPSMVWLLVGGLLHVVAGSPGQILASIGLAAAASFTIALLVHTAVIFLGKWAIFPSILVCIFLNIPTSNSAFPHEFIPPFFQWVSSWHLGAATVNAVRSVLYMGGHGLARPLLTMACWAVVAVAAIFCAAAHRRRKARIEALEEQNRSTGGAGSAERSESSEAQDSTSTSEDGDRSEAEAQEHEAAAMAIGAGPSSPALQGIIRHADGSPLPGAHVVIYGKDGKITGALRAGEDGRFHAHSHVHGHGDGDSSE